MYNLTTANLQDFQYIENLYSDLFEEIKQNISKRKQIVELKLNNTSIKIQKSSICIALMFAPLLTFTKLDNLSVDSLLLIKEKDDINKKLKKYLDNLILDLNLKYINDFKIYTAKILEKMGHFMYQFNEIKGNTVNLYDLFTMMRKDPEIYDLVNFTTDEKLQYAEIEDQIKEKTNKLVEKIYSFPEDNCYKDITSSVSIRQFQQVFINVGLKPDLYGNIYPKPINTSFVRGMRNEDDFYINALGARKSLIINATYVRSSGYLARKLSLLVLNQSIDKDVLDCKTKDLLTVFIENKHTLERYKHRVYVENNEYKIIKPNDVDLIGKRLKVRSPIMCKSKGNKICPTCFGGILEVNDFHPILAGVLYLTYQMTQALLSSKHLLQVNVSKVNLPSKLMNHFYVDKDILFVKNKCTLRLENLLISEEDDEYNYYYVDEFTLIDENGHENHIKLENIELMIEPIEDKLDIKNFSEIELELDSEQEVFKINVENSELSTPLKKIINKIESQEKLNEVLSITLLINELLSLLDKGNIICPASIIECVLREMIRNPDDIQERPMSFNNGNYTILRLTNALLHNPSPAITLAFERLKYVIENNLFDKHSSSIIDGLF